MEMSKAVVGLWRRVASGRYTSAWEPQGLGSCDSDRNQTAFRAAGLDGRRWDGNAGATAVAAVGVVDEDEPEEG
jgi:hypothetical protein